MRRIAPLLALCAIVVLPVTFPSTADGSHARSLVYVNGRPTAVHFNDGDSFRQLDGPYTGRGSRLAGFNTLESFGPSHAWGGWHPFELWVNAKMATYNARHGVWHCFTEGETDTYGRVLLDCPDLARDQIRRGFAHAMQIDDTSARPEYLRAQHAAMRERRGMWAKGIPDFVLTSLHSSDEDPTRTYQYNRLVSVRDGHSERWAHNDRYQECSFQCAQIITADMPRVTAYARRLRADRELAGVLDGVSNIHLLEAVDRYARVANLPAYLPEAASAALTSLLSEARESGQLGQTRTVPGPCMLYTNHRRRFGRERAQCLNGRGLPSPIMAQASSTSPLDEPGTER